MTQPENDARRRQSTIATIFYLSRVMITAALVAYALARLVCALRGPSGG